MSILRKLDKLLYPITSNKPMRHKRAKGKPTLVKGAGMRRHTHVVGVSDTRKRKNVKRK